MGPARAPDSGVHGRRDPPTVNSHVYLARPLALVVALASLPLSGSAVAAPVTSENSQLTVGRQRYWLTTLVEPAALQLKGPGALTLVVRANLPPAGATGRVAAGLRLVRREGERERELARWVVDEPADEANAYAETERYRPSRPVVLKVELPAGMHGYLLRVEETAPLGVVIHVRFEPHYVEEKKDLVLPVVPASGVSVDELVPTAAPGVVARMGSVHGLRGGAVAVAVGMSLRAPILRWLHGDLSVDVFRFLYSGVAPGAAVTGGASSTDAVYDVAPLRLGLVARWRAGFWQPYLGLGGALTLGRERVVGLRGGFDRGTAFSLLGVSARAGLEWFFHPASGPLVAEVRTLGHIHRFAGETLGGPSAVSHAAFEVGYHWVF